VRFDVGTARHDQHGGTLAGRQSSGEEAEAERGLTSARSADEYVHASGDETLEWIARRRELRCDI
jgi:hypothetical protein